MYNNPGSYGGRAPATNPFANAPPGAAPPGAPPIRGPPSNVYTPDASGPSYGAPVASPFPNAPVVSGYGAPPSLYGGGPPPPAQSPYGGLPAPAPPSAYGGGGGGGGFATLNETQIEEARAMSSPFAFVQPSSEKLPASASVKAKTRLPFGLLFQPLGTGGEVPVVNMAGGVGTVIRCRRCRTYINPFMNFEASGRRFVCNVCGSSNDTPQTYFCALDGRGKRADRYDRPELSCGSVDFIAPAEYMSRPPQPPVYCFVIEATPAGMATVDGLVSAVKHWVQSRTGWTEHTQVAFLTFNSNVTFYALGGGGGVREYVVSELEDLFVPVASELLVNLSENESAVMQLLDNLPRVLKEAASQGRPSVESCLGAAMQAADLIIKHVGGKMLVFSSTLPTLPAEFGLKSGKENPRLLNTERESELLRPSNDLYEKLGNELASHQISVDLFVCGGYVDLATICTVAKFTGGEVVYCGGGGEKLSNEVVTALSRETAWESVMRVRVSKGWRISSFHGHMGLKGDLIVAPVVHGDTTFGVQLELDDQKETPDAIVSVQIALLYTNSHRERRIRVHNVALITSPNAMEVNNSANAEVVTSLLNFTAMEMAVKGRMADARNYLHSTISGILQSAGSNCEALKALPLLVLGLLKSPILKATADVPADLRVYYMLRQESAPLGLKVALLYPRMFAVGEMGEWGETSEETGVVEMPDSLGLSAENMTRDGIYVVEDGETILMWIGGECGANKLQGLFGVTSIEQLTPEYAEYYLMNMETGNNAHARKIQNIINQLRMDRRPAFMPLIVVPQRHHLETRFFATLIEDRTLGMQMTYPEFLRMVGAAQVGVPPNAAATAPPVPAMMQPPATAPTAGPAPMPLGAGGRPPTYYR